MTASGLQEHGAHLRKHQVEAVNVLRQHWSQGESLLLADDSGLGKSTSFIAFVHSLRCGSWARQICSGSHAASCSVISAHMLFLTVLRSDCVAWHGIACYETQVCSALRPARKQSSQLQLLG